MEKITSKEIAFDIEDITKYKAQSWIAVIHADGNGLGNILQNIGTQLTKNNHFAAFSKSIEKATYEALKQAFDTVIIQDKQSHQSNQENGTYLYPIRPVIVGGDDVTLIIRADLALKFTEIFLQKFEQKTKENFSQFIQYPNLTNGLTACAGIAFVKESYPLHYAFDLAEQLTKDAKKMVKKNLAVNEMPKSSLSFFKVQDSFINSLDEMKKARELSNPKINFNGGPYLLTSQNGKNSINDIYKLLAEFDSNRSDKSKGISKLRSLITELYKPSGNFEFMKERMKIINKEFCEKINLDELLNSNSILHDAMIIHTFNQE